MARSVHQSLEIRNTLSERISYDCEKSEEGGTDVFFYLMPPPGHMIEHGARARMLHVAPDILTIFPFTTSSTGYGYEPKYNGLDRVCIAQHRSDPYQEPTEHDEVEALLESLPDWLERNPLNGLGFTSQDRFIPTAIAGLVFRSADSRTKSV